MAKTNKKDESTQDSYSVSNDIIKKFGKDAFLTGQNIIETPQEIISVSPKLDMVLGGGIPGGSVVTLAGVQKAGKTLVALHFAAKCQQKNRKVFFLNIEGRIKRRDLLGIKGLNAEDVEIIGSYQGKILSAENYLTIAEDILKHIPHSVVILDSVSQLCSEKELTCNMGEAQRAPGAVLLAQFCKKIANVVPVNDNIVIFIQHLIANTSGYGPTLMASGGRKIKYSEDIGLITRSFKFLRPGAKEEDETAAPYGQEVVWQTTSTAFIAPGQKTTSTIRYGVGIDECSEYIALGLDFGFVNQAGSWLELPTGKKIQGKDKLYHFFQSEEGQEEYDKLKKEIDKIIYPQEK
jgi:recombination protein RecA